MCSTSAQRITEIGRAIDALAIEARSTYSAPRSADAGHADEGCAADRAADGGELVSRLAELWALIADLDPEVAKRVPGYQILPIAVTGVADRLAGRANEAGQPIDPASCR